MIREFVKETKLISQKIEEMLNQAAYDDKTVTVQFSVGASELISFIKISSTDIEVNDNIITLLAKDGCIHHIDLSKFNYIKYEDNCNDDVADIIIDMESEHCAIHFDIL